MKIAFSRTNEYLHSDMKVKENFVAEAVRECKNLISCNSIKKGQICIFDVTNGPHEAPLIGVYWVEKQVLQTFQSGI